MMVLLRRTYDWVLGWAESPYGLPALFLLAFVESSFFPLPPDILLMSLCLSRPRLAFRYATVCTLGSALGGCLGYLLGLGMWGLLQDLFYSYIPGFTPELFNRVQGLFQDYGFWAVFTAGFTPIPYKIFTIGAGVFQLNFLLFIVASVVSRGLRFFLVSWLLYKYGMPVKTFIDRYFNWLTLLVTLVLFGILLLLKGLH
jgi:membrane protein YqaA with SNARE-associated domain